MQISLLISHSSCQNQTTRTFTAGGRGRLMMEFEGSPHSYRRQRGPAWCRIIMLSSTAFAMEFSYAVEAAYGVPVALKTGLDEKYAPVLWAIGPVLGILFQGCMGSASDRCKCSWGRRRPFILGLAIVACICIGLFPYGELLSGDVFHLSGNAHRAFVIAFTTITFVGMDFSLDMLQSPVRAYLLDSVPPERSERGNSIYALMINIGATVGAVIACIPWKKLGLGGDDIFGIQVKVVFGISVVVMIVAQLFTLCSVKEKWTPQNLSAGSEESRSAINLAVDHDRDNKNSTDSKDLAAVSGESSNNVTTNKCSEPSSSDQSSLQNEENVEQHNLEVAFDEENLIAEDSSNERSTYETARCNCHFLKPNLWFKEIVGSIYGTFLFVKYMSFTFLRLWILLFFSWLSFLAMYIFFTAFMGEVVYGGSPTSEDKELRDSYDEGVIIGSAGLAALYFSASVYSLASEWITRCLGLRPVVIGVHMAYLVTCGVTVLYPTVLTAMVMTAVAGVYLALLVNFPFAVIPYYKDAGLLLRKPWLRESDTKGKAVAFIMIGMALSQLILGSCLGFIISALGSTRIVLVVALLGECFATISALFLTTKPASHDCQWCSLKPLVKCFRRLIHRGGLDIESQVQDKTET